MRLKNNIEEWEVVLNNEVWQEDVFVKDISPALLLSYYDLPPAIKRCFSFCATFPKDEFIERDELIKLWMAHNYLKGDESKEMEMVGRECFEYLAAASFFQDFEKDDDGSIIRCKMHDIVHDFAQFLTKSECFIMDSEKQREKNKESSRHATLIVREGANDIVSTSSMKMLHTLLVSYSDFCEAIPILFHHFTCLRALSLGRKCIFEKLPDEVGKLIHLRYLDLSNCWPLKELPETIGNLYNLQTFSIHYCPHLLKLPHAMGKLINLRHLDNFGTSLKSLPKGIGRLTSLQTLGYFIIGDGNDECKTGDLKNLNKLRGSLQIKWLDNAEDASEAEEADLEKKIHIQHLELLFSMKGMKGAIEALKPPPKLKSLQIKWYEDIELPSWIRGSSLTHLKRLELLILPECSSMPPLGELPVLENLQMHSMISLKYVGDGFLGSSSTVAFPKLKMLTFAYTENWEKWEVKKEEERSVMPSLCVLEMSHCPMLERLPDHMLQRKPLQKLEITNCPTLELGYEN